MEVRKGYKQTEVGVIPVDWDVVPMGSLGTFSKGMGIKKDEAKSGEIPCVRYGEIYTHHNDIVREFNSWISPEVAKTSRRLKKGELLFAGSGETKEEIGKCVAFISGVEAYAGGDVVILTPNKGVSKYFGYLFNAPIIAKQKASKGQGDAIVHISATALSSIRIPLPPTLAEQEAIAEALSDADALIESLETLLAKKRQVKQGAMSELLGGKRRVVGSGEWKVKKLGDIFEIGAGGDFDPARSSDVQDERFPYPIYSNAITDNGLYGFCSYNDHQSGSITVTARGTLGVSNYRDHDFTAIGRVIVLKPTQPLDGRFISEYINNRIEFVVESTGVPQLTAPQISKYEILFPPFEEQTAIAEILSDMDAEIRAVEEKLSKARAVKAGMMSELLTGKIRLV